MKTRRLHQTLMDYMVIGISPALIMGMVGSMLFFLLAVFYHGQHEMRMHFIFAMFTMAIVLIARISMEEGIEYASLFGIALAVVTFMALARFAQISGPFANQSMLINCTLIGVVWWSAHKLTWDCTFIDDQQDASGEGLLQGLGLDSDTVAQQASQTADGGAAVQGQKAAVQGKAKKKPASGWYQRMVDRRRRPHTPGVWVVYYAIAALPLFTFGQLLIPATQTAARLHVFRLICVYLACALGLLLTTSFLGLRRYLRQRNLQMPADMAGVWLGLGGVMILSILLVCLFLPRPGAALSVSQLPFGIGSQGPQKTSPHAFGNDGPENAPEATRTSSSAQQPPESPKTASPSPDQPTGEQSQPQDSPSTHPTPANQPAGQQPASQQPSGQPRTGQQQQPGQQPSQQQSGQQQSGQPSSQQQPSQQPGQQQPGQQPGQQQPGQQQPGQQQPGQQQPGQQQPGQQQPGQQPSHQQSGQQQPGQGQPSQQQPSQQQPGQQQSGQQRRPDQRQPGQQPPGQQQPGEQGQPSQQASNQRQPEADRNASKFNERQFKQDDRRKEDSQPSDRRSSDSNASKPQQRSWDVSELVKSAPGWIGNLLKLVFFAALACLAIYFGWKNRARIAESLAQLWRDFCQLLSGLWGAKRRDHSEEPQQQSVATGPAPPAFASFKDPFNSGVAERASTEQLIRYSFEALEAWGRERGCPRAEGITPLEYVQRISQQFETVGPETLVLGDLYSRVAYGREPIAPARRDDLRRLWQQMRAAERARVRADNT